MSETRGPMLLVLVFARITCLAVSTTTESPEKRHVEITPAADMKRIVRHEHGEESALIQQDAKEPGARYINELDPVAVGMGPSGGGAVTTTIIMSGHGVQTTAIYYRGEAPGRTAGNSDQTDGKPKPTALEPIYEPGAPGPPGPPGIPGPVGEPGVNRTVNADGTPVNADGTPVNADGTPYVNAAPSANSRPKLGVSANSVQTDYETMGDEGAPGGIGKHGHKGAEGSEGLMGDMGHRGHVGLIGEKGERGPPGKPNKANAASHDMLVYVIVINSVITALVFIVSYAEFVQNKSPWNLISSPCSCCKRSKQQPLAVESWEGQESWEQ